MIHFRPGSHAYDIVSIIGITGEFPYRSVRLFGNARTYKVLIGRLCEVQTFRDYNSGDEMTCRLLTVTGKSFGKTVRLYKAAIPILKGYGSAFFITNTIACVIISHLILLIWARQNAEKKQRTIIKDAFFVSVYDNDSVILTPCKVNLNTKEISDIVSAPYVITETLTSECVIIGENEFPAEEAESRQNQDSFWY